MGVVRTIHKRNVTTTVESHAEILFMPGGSVHNWANRFTGRIRAATIAAAPSNKRPRWGHYGKPLKGTIISARPRFWGNGGDKQRVYAAVGSSAPHALFVDQGTGVYGGGGAYQGKILPPWSYGSPSLYEHTWRPPGSNRPVGTITIKGQKGQFFFEKGLAAAFRSMRMRAFQVPGEGGPSMAAAVSAAPASVTNFIGATASDGAFISSLTEWRSWRDKAFNAGMELGDTRRKRSLVAGRRGKYHPDRHRRSEAAKRRRAAESAARSKRWREAKKEVNQAKSRVNRGRLTNEQKAIAAAKQMMAKWLLKHPGGRILNYNAHGFNYEIRKGNHIVRHGQPWSLHIADLFADAGAHHTA